MSIEFSRYVRVTEVYTRDRDVTEGEIYEVDEIAEDGCCIIDDVGDSQFMYWEQVERVNCDDVEVKEHSKSISIKYFDTNLPKLIVDEKGDCIDLRVSKVFKVDTPPNEPSKVGEEVSFPYSYKKGDT